MAGCWAAKLDMSRASSWAVRWVGHWALSLAERLETLKVAQRVGMLADSKAVRWVSLLAEWLAVRLASHWVAYLGVTLAVQSGSVTADHWASTWAHLKHHCSVLWGGHSLWAVHLADWWVVYLAVCWVARRAV